MIFYIFVKDTHPFDLLQDQYFLNSRRRGKYLFIISYNLFNLIVSRLIEKHVERDMKYFSSKDFSRNYFTWNT